MAHQTGSHGEADERAGSVAASDEGSAGTLFTRPIKDAPAPLLPWAVAGLCVLLILGALLVSGRHGKTARGESLAGPDAYAPALAVSGIQMSESTSLSGGKSTYIDGHVRNSGSKTVTSATVQVVFANDDALPPQIETLPLALIRTHEPYVDTQPVSAAPLAPGDDREFRLIFEDIRANWNQHVPEVRVVRVVLRQAP